MGQVHTHIHTHTVMHARAKVKCIIHWRQTQRGTSLSTVCLMSGGGAKILERTSICAISMFCFWNRALAQLPRERSSAVVLAITGVQTGRASVSPSSS